MYSARTSSFILLLLAAAPAWSSTQLSCKNVRVNDHSFNLESLSGPHSVVTTRSTIPGTHINTTYTVDLCQPLKKSDGNKNESCPNGTRVCAIRRLLSGESDNVEEVVAIAGALELVGGSSFNWEGTRLSKSKSEADAGKEGLRLVYEGGKHPLTGPGKKRPQKAIIELLCDHDKTGKEGEWEAEDKYEAAAKLRRRDDKDNKDNKDNKDGDDKGGDGEGDGDEGESGVEHQLKTPETALLWEGYHEEDGADVLRLTWHTKAACEKRDGDENKGDGDGDEGDGGESTSASWGFFTWFVIIVFLGIATYLIFGSWLNYNRYGARGWDLLPHGDTIRDIPYLLKDWTRRVLNTVQGAGSRGGYSAV